MRLFSNKRNEEDVSGLVLAGLVLIGLVIGMWRDDISEWVILSFGVGLLVKAWLIVNRKS
jgi:hypothetical protein